MGANIEDNLAAVDKGTTYCGANVLQPKNVSVLFLGGFLEGSDYPSMTPSFSFEG